MIQQGSDTTHLIPVCSGSNTNFVWSALTYGLIGILIVAVVILATLTRKVEMDIFKDSKKVNSFVFSTVIFLYVWSPYILRSTIYILVPEVAFCFIVSPYLVIPFLCTVFLFIPKIWLSRHELPMKESNKVFI